MMWYTSDHWAYKGSIRGLNDQLTTGTQYKKHLSRSCIKCLQEQARHKAEKRRMNRYLQVRYDETRHENQSQNGAAHQV